jgi:hypothetical protein
MVGSMPFERSALTPPGASTYAVPTACLLGVEFNFLDNCQVGVISHIADGEAKALSQETAQLFVETLGF